MTVKYRSDIDGLRALAVMPVILYHFGLDGVAGLSVARGGFIGVDVFFVISGFLISRVIFDQVESGAYDVVGFYTRRARRIFPALFVVYAFCAIASALTGLGAETGGVRNSILSSLFFVSNIYFAGQAGYFGGALDNNPLLHTWSLSVEEQFYILFPLLLIALRRFSPRVRLAVVIATFLISLGWSEYQVRTDPDAAYYSILTRAWELLTGSILAIANPPRLPRRLAEAAGVLGVAMLAFAIQSYDKSTPFPGLTALLPCLGTALIIQSGTGHLTMVGKAFSWAPVRFTGLISYSLYLWHWPLVVFYRLNFGTQKSAMIGLLAVCYIVSALSWRYIEQPVRHLPTGKDRFAALRLSAMAMAALAALAAVVVPVNALVNPMTPESRRIEAFAAGYKPDAPMRSGKCFLTGRANSMAFFDTQTCLAAVPGKRSVLLIGDSHSAQYWAAFEQAWPGAHIMQASASGCLPLSDGRGEKRCRALWDYITVQFLPHHHVDAIALAGLWKGAAPARALETARRLKPFADHVYIIGPNPTFDLPFPRLLMRTAQGDHGAIARHADSDAQKAEAAFTAMRWPAGISYLSYFRAICHGSACPSLASDGNPTTFDVNHLTVAAATDATRQWAAEGLLNP